MDGGNYPLRGICLCLSSYPNQDHGFFFPIDVELCSINAINLRDPTVQHHMAGHGHQPFTSASYYKRREDLMISRLD
jgi:hypothetical protein